MIQTTQSRVPEHPACPESPLSASADQKTSYLLTVDQSREDFLLCHSEQQCWPHILCPDWDWWGWWNSERGALGLPEVFHQCARGDGESGSQWWWLEGQSSGQWKSWQWYQRSQCQLGNQDLLFRRRGEKKDITSLGGEEECREGNPGKPVFLSFLLSTAKCCACCADSKPHINVKIINCPSSKWPTQAFSFFFC